VRLSQFCAAVDAFVVAEDIIASLRYSIRLDFDLWRFRIRRDAVKGLGAREWASRG
jgi:hypothetical protein